MPMKGFVDDTDASHKQQELSSMQPGKPSDNEWWETQDGGGQVDPTDETGQVGPHFTCRCQVEIVLQYYDYTRHLNIWSMYIP